MQFLAQYQNECLEARDNIIEANPEPKMGSLFKIAIHSPFCEPTYKLSIGLHIET